MIRDAMLAGDSRRLGILRAWWLGVVLACAFTLLSGRLIYLHVIARETLRKEAEAHRMHRVVLPAKRGRILDRNGEVLARNVTTFSLVADKFQLRDAELAARGLAKLEGGSSRDYLMRMRDVEVSDAFKKAASEALAPLCRLEPGEVLRRLHKPGLALETLREDMDETEMRQVREAVEAMEIAGFYFKSQQERFYPDPFCATHVLGYVNAENRGQEGIEKTMDAVLRGVPGSRITERNSRGEEIVAFRRQEKPAEHGHGVRLTIDAGLQWEIERRLEAAAERVKAAGISVIFMDVRSGEVLVLANRPHFDLSTREGQRRNRAVSDLYEPGSTLKIVTMGAALDRAIVNPETEVFCHFGYYREGEVELRDGRGYAKLSAEEVLAKSSNIGIYEIAKRLPEGTLDRYLEDFGFGEQTGVWLTAEAPGFVRDSQYRSPTALSRVAMGYGVSVTALQMVTAMGAIANGGELVEPRVVKSIETAEGDPVREFTRQFRRRVLGKRAAANLAGMLAMGVREGTGRGAQVAGVSTAGKTGTARKYSPEAGGYLEGRYVVSFTGFFPAEEPVVAGIVVIDDPQVEAGLRFGGALAAPLFAEFGTVIAKRMLLGEGGAGTGSTWN